MLTETEQKLLLNQAIILAALGLILGQSRNTKDEANRLMRESDKTSEFVKSRNWVGE